MFLKCCCTKDHELVRLSVFLVAQFKILAETKQRNSLSSSCTLNIEPIMLNTGGRSWQANRGIQDNESIVVYLLHATSADLMQK